MAFVRRTRPGTRPGAPSCTLFLCCRVPAHLRCDLCPTCIEFLGLIAAFSWLLSFATCGALPRVLGCFACMRRRWKVFDIIFELIMRYLAKRVKLIQHIRELELL